MGVVFGEVGARPPGARTVDLMNSATDGDLFATWAQAVTSGTAPPLTHKYNCASMFKRAEGVGQITHIAGLERLFERCGRDLRRLVEAVADLRSTTAAWVMRADPRRVAPGALAVDAAEMMEAHAITSVLVVDAAGVLVGVVHIGDLMRAKVI